MSRVDMPSECPGGNCMGTNFLPVDGADTPGARRPFTNIQVGGRRGLAITSCKSLVAAFVSVGGCTINCPHACYSYSSGSRLIDCVSP
jgi:hypothetical protein